MHSTERRTHESSFLLQPTLAAGFVEHVMSSTPPYFDIQAFEEYVRTFEEQCVTFKNKILSTRNLSLTEFTEHSEGVEMFCRVVSAHINSLDQAVSHYKTLSKKPKSKQDIFLDDRKSLQQRMADFLNKRQELASEIVEQLEKDAALSRLIAETIAKTGQR